MWEVFINISHDILHTGSPTLSPASVSGIPVLRGLSSDTVNRIFDDGKRFLVPISGLSASVSGLLVPIISALISDQRCQYPVSGANIQLAVPLSGLSVLSLPIFG